MMAMSKGITFWLREENAAWDDYRVEEKPYGHFANKEDSKKLPPYQLHVYNAVLGLRDTYAREMNKPGYQVIAKELAMDVVFKPELVENWLRQPGVNPKVKTPQFKQELEAVLEKANAEATARGLARRTEAGRSTPAQREVQALERERITAEVDRFYRPIHSVMVERYGEFAASYILNEKTMTELMAGALKLDDLPYAYRKKLILSLADELGIVLPA